MSKHRKQGFTLVELLVVISIIGMLMALILPAVQKSKEVARQIQCLNNMQNLGKAHLQFVSKTGRFCGWVNSVGYDYKIVSWVVPLFAHMDRADLWDRWSAQNFDPSVTPIDVSHPNVYVELLVCPSNPPADPRSSPLHYVVNAGYAGDTSPECADSNCTTIKANTGESVASGVFHDHYGPFNAANSATVKGFNPKVSRVVTPAYLTNNDGQSRTLMLSENVQVVTTWRTFNENRAQLGMVWWPVANTTATNMHQINKEKKLTPAQLQATPINYARPSSYHSAGVNMVFCDGHGKFVNESINYDIYKQLMTTAGRRINADGVTRDPNPPGPLDDSMY